MEKVREYKGVYHVLHGVISPMNGITPDKLKIKELLTRIGEGEIDEVIVAIMNNSSKNSFFTLLERKEIAEKTCMELENVKVITADGMLYDVAHAMGAKYIVKGVRNTEDFVYESNMAGMNKFLAPEVETVFLPTAPEYSFVCSTFVRDLIKYEKSLVGVMHPDAIEYIYEI